VIVNEKRAPERGTFGNMANATRTAVIDVSGVQWASSKARAKKVLCGRPGVNSIEVNPVAQTATVTYDPAVATVADLAGWVRDCGFHCGGRVVPDHTCDPVLEEPVPAHADQSDQGLPNTSDRVRLLLPYAVSPPAGRSTSRQGR